MNPPPMPDEPSNAFDEFAHSAKRSVLPPRGCFSNWIRAVLQLLSLVALCIAALTAALLIGFHIYEGLRGVPPNLPWKLKSAIPLIAVGLSYLALICMVDRTPFQRVLGFLVGSAFILWGVEQFLPDPALVSFIDDVVVFLFVLDLSIVIRENLARSRREQRPRS
jgi:hypothetical protein